MILSQLAQNITTSPILTISAQINEKIAAGESIFNFTVGDFNPQIFPIPEQLSKQTIAAYHDRQTNYPGAFGLANLREGVANTINRLCGLKYSADDIQIASGSRPLIYACYLTLLDPGDKVVYPAPSWNNDYYTQLTNTKAQVVETHPDNDFMPTAQELAPCLKDAQMLALCSPQNPTGTVFKRKQLKEICELVLAENQRRDSSQKPLYVMFDQVYWLLTFGDVEFYHPLSVCPEIENYAVFIDGLSKSFAGTGIRVGWSTAPKHVLPKMRALIAHIGAWAPRPEQVASGIFLHDEPAVDDYLANFKGALQNRLQRFYDGFMKLKNKGLPVDAIAPQAAIYLSVKIDIIGRTTPQGKTLENNEDIHEFLLNEVKLGVLPFSWFDAQGYGHWFRISVGTCHEQDIAPVLSALENNISSLSD